MKVADKTKNKKERVKKKSGVNKAKPKKEQVLVVTQEIKYARWLSGNDKKTRDRVLKALKKWILNCFEKGYEFKENDFTRVWKGLFYAVWMSDKPLVQEELCENIAEVLDLFPAEHLKPALLMTAAGLKMLATEWYGIDHHRLDKFLMLVRRYLRGSLRCLQRCEWSLVSCQKYAKILSGSEGLFAINTPHYARNATSMLLHFADCFLEELAKVSEGKIPEESVAALLRPFVQYTCSGTTPSVVTASRRLLTALLRQSELGLQYQQKTRAWKQMGCPGDGPDALELESDDEAPVQNGDASTDDEMDESEKPLDPRAGRVDVELPLLPVPARLLADMLRDLLAHASSKAHRRVKICLERFETLASGQYPLPVSVVEAPVAATATPRRAARALHQLEHKLRADADELKLRGLSRKHRKRLLQKSRAGLSIVEDVQEYNKALSNQSNNGEWLVESTESKSKKAERDTSNKENQEKIKKNGKTNAQKRKNSGELTGDGNNKKQNLNNTELNGVVNNKKQKLNSTELNGVVNKKQKLNSTELNGVVNKKQKHGTVSTVVSDISNKKQKLDKHSKNLVNNESKKNNIVSNKTQSNKDKSKTSPLKNNKSQKETEAKRQKYDVKGKEKRSKLIKDIKNMARDIKQVKTKKPKNQPQIISHKSETSNKTVKDTNENSEKTIKTDLVVKPKINKKAENPTFLANKVKNFQKQLPSKEKKERKESAIKKDNYDTTKKVKFSLKNNSMQKPVDYYKSVRQSPSIPFDSAKRPSKTNLKPSTPSPINPFFKKKLRMRN